MNEWMNECIVRCNEYMQEWTNECMNIELSECMHECIMFKDEYTQTNGLDECMGECRNGMDECKNKCTWMSEWLYSVVWWMHMNEWGGRMHEEWIKEWMMNALFAMLNVQEWMNDCTVCW